MYKNYYFIAILNDNRFLAVGMNDAYYNEFVWT